jgi:DNA-binding NtrC family response regulator
MRMKQGVKVSTNPILVVDDEPAMRLAISESLSRKGYSIVTAEDGSDAMEKVRSHSFDMVITDMKMPKADGMEVLKYVREVSPETPVIMVTAFGTISHAVEAMKVGASDYIVKPFSSEVLESTVKRSLGADSEFTGKVPAIKDASSGKGIITDDPKMLKLLSMARNAAASNATVLILGESGTGKELVARYIHDHSLRKDEPFVAVNCASIPNGLLESELFGHEKGSFTSAFSTRIGKFEQAHNGTILLDEVGEMEMVIQAKLLRVIQEREVDRIGGKKSIPLDIRIVATTNKNLWDEVKKGSFREDLFYRLNVFPLNLPPLRERINDIHMLAAYFLERFCEKHEKRITHISDEAFELLSRHTWKGNVRELENSIERAVLLGEGETLLPDVLFLEESAVKDYTSMRGASIWEVEKELIFKTLNEVDGNKTKAAKILGISVRTLRNKLNDYNATA